MFENAICIIPARGGSKRIPRKNIRNFLGKPIIAYSISAAIDSGLFSKVMVSTEDHEIAQIAKSYGADVPFLRNQNNAKDNSTTIDVLIEVLDRFSVNNINFDYLCCLYPCAPFVTPDLLRQAFEHLQKGKFDAVIPIVPYGFPPERSFGIKQGRIEYKFPQYEQIRSQDIERSYHDAGQFYWGRVDALLSERSLVPKNTSYIELDEVNVQDIDNETDWKLAELKYNLNQK